MIILFFRTVISVHDAKIIKFVSGCFSFVDSHPLQAELAQKSLGRKMFLMQALGQETVRPEDLKLAH